MLRMVHRWPPERAIVIVADAGFAALDLLAGLPEQVAMVTRLRLDAALYTPPPACRAHQAGRPRKKGQRLPTLAQIAADLKFDFRNYTAC
jgi:hypothetical protein